MGSNHDSYAQTFGDFFLYCVAGLIVVVGVMSFFKLYDLVRDMLRERFPPLGEADQRELIFRAFTENGREVVKWKRVGDSDWQDVQLLEEHGHD